MGFYRPLWPGGPSVGGVDDWKTLDLRGRLSEVAERPGMWGLQDDYRQVCAFVSGCAVGDPGSLDHLTKWAVARIGGARDKYGWRYALAVLAAKRVSEADEQLDRRTPLARAFLRLVCDYLSDVEDPGGVARIASDYQAARDAYSLAHESDAHVSGTDPFDPEWHEECDRWLIIYLPCLAYAPDTTNPWAAIKTHLDLE